MGKLLKSFAALLLLAAGVLGLAVLLVDADDYEDDIRASFAAATGRELVIEGGLEISLLPRPILEIKQASVSGAQGIEGPALAKIDLVQLYPRLLPLFSGRVEPYRVRISGLQLVWDEPSHASRDQNRPLPASAAVDLAAGSGAMPGSGLGTYDGSADNVHSPTEGTIIGDLEVLAGPITPYQPISVRVTGSVGGGDGSLLAKLEVEGMLSASGGSGQFRMELLAVDLDGLRLGDGLGVDLQLRAVLELDLVARRYVADEVTLKIQASSPALAGGTMQATAGAHLALDEDAETLKATAVSIRSGTLLVRGAALGQTLSSAPVFTGQLVVDELDLRAWLEQQGLPALRTADDETFRRFFLETCWRLEDEQLGFQDLILDIDQTRFVGELERVATKPARFRFDLIADRLDLDHYLPSTARAQAQQPQTSQRRSPTAEPVALKVPHTDQPASVYHGKTGTVPAAAPEPTGISIAAESVRDLDLEGRLRVGELKVARLHLGDADLRIRAMDGHLEIDNQVKRFYEGQLHGRVGLDASHTVPSVWLVQRAERIQAGSLLADLSWSDRIRGHGGISVDLMATGRNAEALRKTLAGTLAVNVDQGAVKGVNLERLIREAEARLRGKAPPQDLPTQTEFKDLRASADIKDGLLTNRDLIARVGYVRITGSGTLDLARERFDYRFEPVFVKPPKGHGIRELEGIPIPVQLTGPFDRPRWEVDVGGALSAAAQRRLGEQGGHLLKRLEERTGIKGLERGLKSLFGR